MFELASTVCLIDHIYLHFVKFESTDRLVGDFEFAAEIFELFKLKFFNYNALLVC